MLFFLLLKNKFDLIWTARVPQVTTGQCYDMCLNAPRSSITLVPGGHAMLCASCADTINGTGSNWSLQCKNHICALSWLVLACKQPIRLVHTLGQKIAPFYFCNDFVKSFYAEMAHMYQNKFETKRHQIISLSWRIPLWNAAYARVFVTVTLALTSSLLTSSQTFKLNIIYIMATRPSSFAVLWTFVATTGCKERRRLFLIW